MTEEKKHETDATAADSAAESKPEPEQSSTSGPTFTQPPGDPLAGVKKGASDVMASMDGKTVSMKVYVGSIIAVILLMMLARCGG